MPKPMHKHPRSTASTPVASLGPMDRIEQIWASLPAADREVFLGHSRLDLSAADKLKLAKILTSVGRQARRAR